MAKVAPLSGFPEWTPAGVAVEQELMRRIADVFELHGYARLDTRAVEPVSRLAGDSDAAKEIYALTRLAEPGGKAKLGLHFDLTVPFARYVEEFQSQLQFPFRRYQIQKVWRGERPQEGRFREFYQADIDVVARETLPAHLEVEVATVMARALGALPVPGVTMRVNDRRLMDAAYAVIGVDDVPAVLRSVDKLDKIGPDGVGAELATGGLTSSQADAVLALATVEGTAGIADAVARVLEARGLTPSEELAAAASALEAVVASVNAAVPDTAIVDLRIARGLDYYTGTVFETFVVGSEALGSICSGGRYESLVAGGGMPGVGMSIGLSRLVSHLLATGAVAMSRPVPSAVYVAVDGEESRSEADAVATALRGRGIACEVSANAAKFGKQIQAAEKRGIPFVWFTGTGEVKDIRTGDQEPADPRTWEPPSDDRLPRLTAQ